MIAHVRGGKSSLGGQIPLTRRTIIRHMKQFIRTLAVLSVAAGLAPAGLAAQQQERSTVPEKYRWNLAEIYPDDQAWRAAKNKLVAEIPSPRPFKGTLDRQRRSSPMRWSWAA